MPYLWTDPDVVLSHKGVDVYYTYPDDMAENPPSEHRFGFSLTCTDDCDDYAFDLHDVAPLLPVETRDACQGDAEALITALIDAGFLTEDGFVIDGALYDNAASIRTAVAARGKGAP
jgi:hypothetical protein